MITLSHRLKCRAAASFILFISSMSVGAVTSAHDFWLEPEQFQIEAGETHTVNTRIGHPDDRSSWALQPERLIGVRAIGPSGLTDQHQYFSPGDAALTFMPEEPGLHWFTIETQDAISDLPADQFNDYVQDEHLMAIQTDRVRRRETDRSGVERYSRRGKTLIAVGDWADASMDHVTKPLGLTLEIIPTENPYLLDAGESLPLEVRYRGQPLSNAQIKIIRLDETVETEKIFTDQTGRVEVTRPEEGRWMYHVIWGTPLADNYQQDFDTIFSSATFQFGE